MFYRLITKRLRDLCKNWSKKNNGKLVSIGFWLWVYRLKVLDIVFDEAVPMVGEKPIKNEE